MFTLNTALADVDPKSIRVADPQQTNFHTHFIDPITPKRKERRIIKHSTLGNGAPKKRSKSVGTPQHEFQHTVYVKQYASSNDDSSCDESAEDFEVRSILTKTKSATFKDEEVEDFEYERCKNPGLSLLTFEFLK
ncbi:Uncharacterized protein QTN25_009620 [Entamoeba marina]